MRKPIMPVLVVRVLNTSPKGSSDIPILDSRDGRLSNRRPFTKQVFDSLTYYSDRARVFLSIINEATHTINVSLSALTMALSTTLLSATTSMDQACLSTSSKKILPETVQCIVLSFLDASDVSTLIDVIRSERSNDSHAVPCQSEVSSRNLTACPWWFSPSSTRTYLRSLTSIQLSYLLKRYPNRFTDDCGQENAVASIIDVVISNEPAQSQPGQRKPHMLRHLELSNLRNVHFKRGEQTFRSSWLYGLSMIPIVSLDLTNSSRLDEDFAVDYLDRCPTTLRHLNLLGCVRIGPRTIRSISERHTALESLSLGCCSQNIRDDSIQMLLRRCTSLRHIDFQGLAHLRKLALRDLPSSIKSLNLSGCEQCLIWIDLAFALEFNEHTLPWDEDNWDNEEIRRQRYSYWRSKQLTLPYRLQYLYLNSTGSASPNHSYIGVSLAQVSFGMALREVHLAGCDVSDWDVDALAFNCQETLTVFQMRAGSFSNTGLSILVQKCRKLSEIDVCACDGLSDAGIVAAFSNHHGQDDDVPDSKRQKLESLPSLRVLRLAGIHNLTDKSLDAISHLKSLRILSVSSPKISSKAVADTVKLLPQLIEIDAKDIALDKSLPRMLRECPATPSTLQVVNQRSFSRPSDEPKCELGLWCCTARTQSQRLSSSVCLRPMYHCRTCDLIPQVDRGTCGTCIKTCHKGHDTFLGAFTRYYCDCAFDCTPDNSCKAFTVPNNKSVHQADPVRTRLETKTH